MENNDWVGFVVPRQTRPIPITEIFGEDAIIPIGWKNRKTGEVVRAQLKDIPSRRPIEL